MGKKYRYVIEVMIPNVPESWQKVVNSKIRQPLEKLRAAVEELGGEFCVRY